MDFVDNSSKNQEVLHRSAKYIYNMFIGNPQSAFAVSLPNDQVKGDIDKKLKGKKLNPSIFKELHEYIEFVLRGHFQTFLKAHYTS